MVNAARILRVGEGVLFYCCWCAFYTTARVNAARNSAVGVGVMLPILLLLVRLLHYGEGQCCPNFSRWCRRMLPILLLLVPFTLR